jgi:hypothetical protein
MGYLDVAPLLADERNYLLMAERGGIIFCWQQPAVYQVHTTFLKPDPNIVGPDYIGRCCLAAYRWMFTQTDAMVLTTLIAANNRAAAIFAPLYGWTKEGERKQIWPSFDAGMQDMGFYTQHYHDWIRKFGGDLEQTGRQFHVDLLEEFKRHGKEENVHPDDPWHDRHVGACAEMIKADQMLKAVYLYNQWASFAGYGLITLVSETHGMIDIGNAVLHVKDGNIKVVKCR